MKNVLPFCLVLVGLTGCKVLPVQMTHVTLFESYRQSFDFPDGSQDKVLEILLGKETATTLVEGKTDQYKNLKNGNCEALGEAAILFSLLPSTIESDRQFKFLVNGHGRYRIYFKTDNVLYYWADFRIREQAFDADSLFKGHLRVKFVQQLVNNFYFSEPAFSKSPALLQKLREKYNDVELDLDIQIKQHPKGKIFYLDYSAKHVVSVKGIKIGSLVFNHLDMFPEKYKIFDLRGINKYVKNDY